MTTERIENMAGGQGHVLIKRLLNEKQLNGKCGLYAEVTLEPGCSLGYHEHHNESETYYILSGKGIYSDNGTLRNGVNFEKNNGPEVIPAELWIDEIEAY